MIRFTCSLFAACLVLALVASAPAGEEFLLSNPESPQKASSAVRDRNVLRITDAAGKRFEYQRRADLDSETPAGRFLGYYCQQADQYLLWPVKGTGAMLIGTPSPGKINWRKSRMQVRPRGDPAGAASPDGPARPAHVALAEGPDGALAVARISAQGHINFYTRTEAGWRYRQAKATNPLVPGAPLAVMFDSSSAEPVVYTFDARGALVEVSASGRLRTVAVGPENAFTPGGHLAVIAVKKSRWAFAVDRRGRPWQFDLVAGKHAPIQSAADQLVPGSPLAVVVSTQTHLLAVDRQGKLIHYTGDPAAGGRWSLGEAVAERLAPGGGVAAVRPRLGDVELAAASVDATGTPRIFTLHGNVWDDQHVEEMALVPGCPLTYLAAAAAISAVTADGTWVQRPTAPYAIAPGESVTQTVARGFPPAAPVAASAASTALAAVDATGRIVLCAQKQRAWRPTVLTPPRGFVPRFPQLIDRKVKPGAPLAPAEVMLENRHDEPLRLVIADLRRPGDPAQVTIKAGGSRRWKFDRDARAEIVETYLERENDGQTVRRDSRHPVPPRQLYTVAVFVDRAALKNETAGPVSVGVFPIAAGDRLAPHSRLDVYREAKSRGNPGAAAPYGPPR